MAPDRPAPPPSPTPSPTHEPLDRDVPACPRCAARLRPGAPWCTQCFLDLTPPPVPAPARKAVQAPGAVPAPYDELDERPRWPCTACGTPNLFADASCQACGLAFLAGLQDPGVPTLELPLVGDLAALSGGRRIGLALIVVVLVMLATLVLGLLFS